MSSFLLCLATSSSEYSLSSASFLAPPSALVCSSCLTAVLTSLAGCSAVDLPVGLTSPPAAELAPAPDWPDQLSVRWTCCVEGSIEMVVEGGWRWALTWPRRATAPEPDESDLRRCDAAVSPATRPKTTQPLQERESVR